MKSFFQVTLFARAQYRNENGQMVEEKTSKIEIIDIKSNEMEFRTAVLPNTEYTAQMCTINKSGCGPMTNISTSTQCKSLSNGKIDFIFVVVAFNVCFLKHNFLSTFLTFKKILIFTRI